MHAWLSPAWHLRRQLHPPTQPRAADHDFVSPKPILVAVGSLQPFVPANGFNGTCSSGVSQSPINIPMAGVAKTCSVSHGSIKPSFGAAVPGMVQNTGHSLQVCHTAAVTQSTPLRLPQLPIPFETNVSSPPVAAAQTLVVWHLQINLQAGSQNLTIGNRVLTVGQFHWHASSEHTVDNFHHAMELHFVLTYVDTGERHRWTWCGHCLRPRASMLGRYRRAQRECSRALSMLLSLLLWAAGLLIRLEQRCCG